MILHVPLTIRGTLQVAKRGKHHILEELLKLGEDVSRCLFGTRQ